MPPFIESNIQKGKSGEDIAISSLKRAGYRIVERNYRCLFGEIDIVARDADTIVFLEVKSRRTGKFGAPQEAVGPAKQAKLSMIALNYLKQKRLDTISARFDVVAVWMPPGGEFRAKIIKNAFDLKFGR
ncbi:MAG: YraN family protein [Syntrophales bacterium]